MRSILIRQQGAAYCWRRTSIGVWTSSVMVSKKTKVICRGGLSWEITHWQQIFGKLPGPCCARQNRLFAWSPRTQPLDLFASHRRHGVIVQSHMYPIQSGKSVSQGLDGALKTVTLKALLTERNLGHGCNRYQ